MADNVVQREDLTVPDGELGAQLRVVFEAGKELVVSCVDWRFAVSFVVLVAPMIFRRSFIMTGTECPAIDYISWNECIMALCMRGSV